MLTHDQVHQRWGRRALEATLAARDVHRILPGVYCASAYRTNPVVWGRAELLTLTQDFASGATSRLETLAMHEVFVGPPFDVFEWQATLDLERDAKPPQ